MSSLARAYAACEALARSHYENFPVASHLLPAPMRPHVAAVYAFARIADDIADEGGAPPAERQEQLRLWQDRVHRAAINHAGQVDDRAMSNRDELITLAIGHSIRTLDLPLQLFDDLVSAFGQDTMTTRYASWADVFDYCRRSANPVGQLVLALFGHRDAARRERSDDICTALQLTNFWQDVAGDLDRGRVYLPEEDLERFSGSRDALAARRTNPAFRELLAFEIGRTRALFARGLPLADMVGRRLRHEVRIFARGGLAILGRIEAAGYDVFTRRPTLGRAELVRLVVRGLWR